MESGQSRTHNSDAVSKRPKQHDTYQVQSLPALAGRAKVAGFGDRRASLDGPSMHANGCPCFGVHGDGPDLPRVPISSCDRKYVDPLRCDLTVLKGSARPVQNGWFFVESLKHVLGRIDQLLVVTGHKDSYVQDHADVELPSIAGVFRDCHVSCGVQVFGPENNPGG